MLLQVPPGGKLPPAGLGQPPAPAAAPVKSPWPPASPPAREWLGEEEVEPQPVQAQPASPVKSPPVKSPPSQMPEEQFYLPRGGRTPPGDVALPALPQLRAPPPKPAAP